jgi:TRAP-type C4-dicarboxylate transport system permease small subunit
MTIKTIIIIALTIIFLSFIINLINNYQKKQVNKYIFEIVKPKPKGKKWIYLIMNIQNYVIVSYAKY